MIIRNFIIALIIFLCCISSVTDISKGKVRNVFLIIIGLPAVVLNFIYLFNEPILDIKLLAISVVVPLLAATLLYVFKIWAGGDYKLFLILIFAIPYEIICQQYNGLSAGILIIGISFSIGYVYLVFESLFGLIKHKTGNNNVIKKSFKDFAKYIPLYFFIGILQKFIIAVFGMIGINLSDWAVLLIVIAGVLAVKRFRIFDSIVVPCAISALYVVLAIFDMVQLFDIKLLILWALILMTYLIRNFVNQFNYQSITYDELKPGMILSFETSCIIANFPDCGYDKISKENLESRLSKQDVNEIVRFYKNQEDVNKLLIIKKVPFAFFISIATVLLIIGCLYYAD